MGNSAGDALSLLRSILRAHRRKLPPVKRSIGDSYVLNEFRLHAGAPPPQARQFLQAWVHYRDSLISGAGESGRGLQEQPGVRVLLNSDQEKRMGELQKAIDEMRQSR